VRGGCSRLPVAGTGARSVVTGGAGPDHPLHPALPETRYLTFLLYALD